MATFFQLLFFLEQAQQAGVVRQLTSSVTGVTSTPDIDGVLQRDLTSAVTGQTSTPDLDGILQRFLSSAVLGQTSTPDIDIEVSSTIQLTSTIAGVTSTPDIDAITIRSLTSSVTGVTSTPNIDISIEGAGLKEAILNTVLPTGGATVDFTIAGFGDVMAMEFVAVNGTADGVAVPHVIYGRGVTDGTNEWTFAIHSEDGAATNNTDRYVNTSGCLALLTPETGAVDGLLSFNSNITDGMRFNIDNAFNGAYRVAVKFYGGENGSVSVGTFVEPTATDESLSITAPGFRPSYVLIESVGSGSPDTTAIISQGVAIDDATPPTQRGLMWGQRESGATATVVEQLFTNRVAGAPVVSMASLDWACEVTAMTATGFNVANRDSGAPANIIVGYMAVQAGDQAVALQTYPTPTSTGSDAVSGLGFEPQSLRIMMSRLPSVNTFTDNDDAGTFGLSLIMAADQASMAISSDDGAADMDTSSNANSIAVNTLDHLGADEIVATSTLDADGWTLNYSAVRAQACQFIVLAVERVSAPSGITRQLTSSVTGITSTPDVDGILVRELTSAVAGATSTPDIDGILERALTSSVAGQTSTPSIDGLLQRTLSSSVSGLTSTPDIDGILSRALTSSVLGQTSTPDIDIQISGVIQISSSVLGQTSTPDIDVSISRELSSSVTGMTSTPNIDIQISGLIQLTSAVLGQTSTPDVDAFLSRSLSSAVSGQTSTPDVDGALVRNLISSVLGITSTPDVDAILRRVLASVAVGATSTPDVDVITARALSSAVLGQTSTPAIDIEISGLIQLTSSVLGVTSTPDIDGILSRSLTSAVTGVTSTPDIDGILVRALTSSVLGVTSTPDIDIEISGLLQIVSSVLGQTSTPDIDSISIRGLASAVLGQASTPDVDAILLRELVSVVVGQTSTPDDVDGIVFSVLQLVSAVLGQTSTPDVDAILRRALAPAVLSQTSTPDLDVMISRELSSSVLGQTSTPDNLSILVEEIVQIIDPVWESLTRQKRIVSL